jgi:hypothetical protein
MHDKERHEKDLSTQPDLKGLYKQEVKAKSEL